ncbi:hypothetical protein [Spirosoma validum]|uniref:Uncharacterized protein n=1 Tax=Spirosoma validum TaxID=2771355 RepID=A0A927B5V5_9BACT|nr:hypothetical protein [Spirosoma validum]MBD2755806.1 hypothetical protein [Spirosoma validum]
MRQQPNTSIEQFTIGYKALLDTEWIDDPANPIDHIKGFIGQGETIWLHPDHSGIGPVWQQARLVDKTLRFVHLHDFKKIA